MKNVEIRGSYISGLPTNKNEFDVYKVTFDNEFLKIEKIYLFKPKTPEIYKIDISKIISVELVNETNIESKNKSVIGRGITGGLLFGPAGLILGGLSGTGTKSKTVIKEILNVSYYGINENDIKTILFDVSNTILGKNKFINEFKKENKTNEIGEIIL